MPVSRRSREGPFHRLQTTAERGAESGHDKPTQYPHGEAPLVLVNQVTVSVFRSPSSYWNRVAFAQAHTRKNACTTVETNAFHCFPPSLRGTLGWPSHRFYPHAWEPPGFSYRGYVHHGPGDHALHSKGRPPAYGAVTGRLSTEGRY